MSLLGLVVTVGILLIIVGTIESIIVKWYSIQLTRAWFPVQLYIALVLPGSQYCIPHGIPQLLEKRASRRSLPDTPTRAHHHEPAIGTMTQHAVPSQSESKSNSNSTDGDPSSPTSESDESNDVDLTTCSNVNYESRNGLPGVCYKDLGTTSSWTPVVGRRKKRPQLPPHILRRFPPDHPLRQPGRPNLGPESSSEEDEELVIPQNADVYFNVVKGIPGLQIRTRNTSRWTPVASRTRSKSKSNKVT